MISRSSPEGVPQAWADAKKTEGTKVLEWRMLCLTRAGADNITAAALATTRHDLHHMERAIRAGISMEQAADIFL